MTEARWYLFSEKTPEVGRPAIVVHRNGMQSTVIWCSGLSRFLESDICWRYTDDAPEKVATTFAAFDPEKHVIAPKDCPSREEFEELKSDVLGLMKALGRMRDTLKGF